MRVQDVLGVHDAECLVGERRRGTGEWERVPGDGECECESLHRATVDCTSGVLRLGSDIVIKNHGCIKFAPLSFFTEKSLMLPFKKCLKITITLIYNSTRCQSSHLTTGLLSLLLRSSPTACVASAPNTLLSSSHALR